MDKKTKMWLGIGLVAAAAYYFWEKSKTDVAKDAAPKANYGGYYPSHRASVQSVSTSRRRR